MSEFVEFPKMARWSREVVITEKIDGTNACVYIGEDGGFQVGSRTKWITPTDDNHGFARWAYEHKDELMLLGPGRHFGEWWGCGIQRGYNMSRKHFSLFNTSRWNETPPPSCCEVVPELHRGMMEPGLMESCVAALVISGSIASPGFMNPEGCVLFHTAGNVGFKKTIKKDEVPKALASKPDNRPGAAI